MTIYPLQKQNYDLIDPMIREWASENSLRLYTESQNVEVRSVWFCDDTGEARFQIGIDPLKEDGAIGVHVYEVKKLIRESKASKPTSFLSTALTLRETLDEALDFVRSRLG